MQKFLRRFVEWNECINHKWNSYIQWYQMFCANWQKKGVQDVITTENKTYVTHNESLGKNYQQNIDGMWTEENYRFQLDW